MPTWLPALLLLGVAANQLWLVHTTDLDPWKGGGFGMFSTTEHTPTRHTHLYVHPGRGKELRVELPDALEDAEERLRAFPSPARIDAFLRDASREFEREHPAHRAIRVEIWSSHFHPETLRQQAVLLRDVTRGRDASG